MGPPQGGSRPRGTPPGWRRRIHPYSLGAYEVCVGRGTMQRSTGWRPPRLAEHRARRGRRNPRYIPPLLQGYDGGNRRHGGGWRGRLAAASRGWMRWRIPVGRWPAEEADRPDRRPAGGVPAGPPAASVARPPVRPTPGGRRRRTPRRGRRRGGRVGSGQRSLYPGCRSSRKCIPCGGQIHLGRGKPFGMASPVRRRRWPPRRRPRRPPVRGARGGRGRRPVPGPGRPRWRRGPG